VYADANGTTVTYSGATSSRQLGNDTEEQHLQYRCLMKLARLQAHGAPVSITASDSSHSTNIIMPGSAVFATANGTIFTHCHGQQSVE
jgi:hypothetical protein